MRSSRLAVAGLCVAAGAGGFALLATERRQARVAGPTALATRPAAPEEPEGSRLLSKRDEGRRRVAPDAAKPASGTAPSAEQREERPAGDLVVTIVGRVVDEAGAPIAGAELVTHDDVVRARSGGDGWLQTAPDDRAPWPERWFSELRVFAPGHAVHSFHARVSETTTLYLGTLVLAPGADVAGVVHDEIGEPLRDAEVTLLGTVDWPQDEAAARAEGIMVQGDLFLQARTDEEGRYRLRGAPPGEAFLVGHAEHMQYAWTQPFTVRAGEDSLHDLVLSSDRVHRARWTVRVLDPHGAAVPGAMLEVRGKGRADAGALAALAALGYGQGHADRIDPAGEDGCVVLWVPVGEELRITAWDPDERWRASREERLVSGSDAAFDLVLREPRILTLVVADETGRPIPWSNVRLAAGRRWALGDDLRPTGADGNLQLPLPDGQFTLRAFAPGHASAVFGPYDPDSLAQGEPLVLRLARGRALSGRVLASGEPVGNASVRLRWKQAPELLWSSSEITALDTPFLVTAMGPVGHATTDGDGGFVISVETDSWCTVLVEAEGFPLQTFGPFAVSGAGSHGHELALARGGAIEGRLLVRPGESASGRLVGASCGSGVAFTALVGEDGRYLIEDLAPGDYEVRACFPPASRVNPLERALPSAAREFVADCVVREGETTRFDLDVRSEGSVVLEGSLANNGGGMWEARLRRPGEVFWFARAAMDAAGHFRLALSRPGSYWIEIPTDTGLFRQPLSLQDGVQEWNCVLRWGQVTVLHAPQGGGPLKDGALVLSWHGSAQALYEVRLWNNSMTNRGTTTITFPAGEVEVLLDKDSARETLREPFTLLAGETVVLDLSR